MKGIGAIALDVDGVLTDGGVWWGPEAQEWKRFSYADIMGVALGIKAGLKFALISGEDSPLVDRFAAKLGIACVEKNCKDKAGALERFAASHGMALSAVGYMGDDVNDLGDAHPAARRCAGFVAHRAGGHGAVRELIDAVLAAKAVDV
jgi:3-deoxy-D-manno-octulosonate 8-phosphate phosphatase (KDO 8-P phosphatase)